MSKNPAVLEAKNGRDFAVRVSLDGVNYQLHPVAPALMDAVTNRIKIPLPPMWFNKEMERDEPNPGDPAYLQAVDEANRQRGIATMDAMVMFGILLPDGLPADDGWLKKLEYLEKRGLLDLSGYDLADPFDLEFLYKRFVLADGDMVQEIGSLSALTAAEVKQAGNSFPGNT